MVLIDLAAIEIAAEVIGWCGTLTAALLSFPDAYAATKNIKKYSESFRFVGPQGLLLFNSILWLTYGFLIWRLQVWIANLICLVLGIYTAIRVVWCRTRNEFVGPIKEPA